MHVTAGDVDCTSSTSQSFDIEETDNTTCNPPVSYLVYKGIHLIIENTCYKSVKKLALYAMRQVHIKPLV